MVSEFMIEIPQAEVDDLHERLDRVRWPEEVPGAGSTRGIGAGRLRELAEYWRTGFDWRAQEARLNRFPQFTTEIDGQRIQFLHVRSSRPDAKPLLMTHGFPSSVAEFWTLIDLLSSPGSPRSSTNGPTCPWTATRCRGDPGRRHESRRDDMGGGVAHV